MFRGSHQSSLSDLTLVTVHSFVNVEELDYKIGHIDNFCRRMKMVTKADQTSEGIFHFERLADVGF